MEGRLNMDVALALDKLIPAAKYRGSLSTNTQEAYNKLIWEDERDKPSWIQIEASNSELVRENIRQEKIKEIQKLEDDLEIKLLEKKLFRKLLLEEEITQEEKQKIRQHHQRIRNKEEHLN